MKRQYKRVFTMSPAWSYQEEIEELNNLSEQGWQLTGGGHFLNKYKKNSDIRYRYQLDYSGKVEDMGRYIETFREQGWEYINTTFNGWSCFRKLWNPNIPEEQYEIFTDQPSLREMTGRWIKFAALPTVIVTTLSVISGLRLAFTPNLPLLVLFLTTLLETAFLACGIFLMRNPSKNTGFKGGKALFISFLVTVVIGVCSFYYLESYRHFNCVSSGEMAAIPAETENAMEWISFDIPYTDNYYMNLDIAVDSPMCFSIMDSSDTVIYTVTESAMNMSRTKLRLEKGTYRVYFSDYEGGWLEVSLRIN